MTRYDLAYPSKAALRRLKHWRDGDPLGWLQFAHSIWQIWGWDDEPKVGCFVYVSTGGWSGNEDIIAAMRSNSILWSRTWEGHRTGGHYTFWVRRTLK